MRMVSLSGGVLLAIVLPAALTVMGCADSSTPGNATSTEGEQVTGAVDDHSGWWCATHGVPEELCAQCNSLLAAEYQQKGDWCEQHNRPQSQCFICQPELAAKFAAQYEAKFGKKPLLQPESATE